MADVTEAKEPIVETKPEAQPKPLDESIDEFFDKVEKETPGTSSIPEETKEAETKPKETSEVTPSLKSAEESKEETEIPKEFHEHDAWKRIKAKETQAITERDEALSKIAELEKGTTDADKQRIDKVLNSPEFIRFEMGQKGYKDEAINARLAELGHKVEAPPTDDVKLIIDKLGLNPETVDANMKATITDIAKIASIIANDRIDKTLPGELEPLREASLMQQREKNASTITKQMEEIVSNEGVLDYKKDIEPEVNKFLDANPDATQEDVLDHFNSLSRQLTIGRLKQGNKQEVTSSLKETNKPVNEGVVITPGKIPPKTGDVNQDMDNFLDAVDYR